MSLQTYRLLPFCKAWDTRSSQTPSFGDAGWPIQAPGTLPGLTFLGSHIASVNAFVRRDISPPNNDVFFSSSTARLHHAALSRCQPCGTHHDERGARSLRGWWTGGTDCVAHSLLCTDIETQMKFTPWQKNRFLHLYQAGCGRLNGWNCPRVRKGCDSNHLPTELGHLRAGRLIPPTRGLRRDRRPCLICPSFFSTRHA